MKKIYHLGNCTTCQAIIKNCKIEESGFIMQDIKLEKITPDQLDEMKKMSGSYESLFSRRAMKYKELGLKDKKLEEKDYRKLILEEYTFLKRPVTIINDKLFTGSEKKTVEALKLAVQKIMAARYRIDFPIPSFYLRAAGNIAISHSYLLYE